MTVRLYRDRTSGALWEGAPGVARHFSHLEPVEGGAKPLAYVSIPESELDPIRFEGYSAPKAKSTKKTSAPAPLQVEREDESE